VQNLDAQTITELLQALGSQLEAEKQSFHLLVVGGAALSLRGWVPRSTTDVDVLALARPRGRGHELEPPDFPPELQLAIDRVSRDFGLTADWLNAEVGMQWRTGLPEGVDKDIEWRIYGALHLGLASRQTLITLKLAAAVDHGPESVHVQDLIALRPRHEELAAAEAWVVEQDALPEFADIVAQVVAHVRGEQRNQ